MRHVAFSTRVLLVILGLGLGLVTAVRAWDRLVTETQAELVGVGP